MNRRWAAVCCGTILGVLLPATLGLAQTTELGIDVRDSTFESDGATELVVNVTGSAKPDEVDPDVLQVTENGDPVAIDEIAPLLLDDAVGDDVVTMLAIDISGSMRGEQMNATRPAAIEFARELTSRGVAVALMTYGSDTTILSGPTTDGDELTERIEDIVVGGSTSLFDGIIDAAAELEDLGDVQRNIVVFTDRGGDTSSEAPLEVAVNAANAVDAPLLFAALEVVPEDLEVIDQLAEGTDGRVLIAADTGEIAGVFEELASDIASQYVVSYTSAVTDASELDLEVTVSANGATATTSFVAPNPRQTSPQATTRTGSGGLFANDVMLYVGLLAAFVAVLLVLALMFTGQRSRADRVLSEQMARYIEGVDRRAGRSTALATQLRDRAMALVEAAPKPKGFDERLTLRLEQAAWPLRNGEFLGLCLGAAVVVGVVIGLASNWAGGVLVAVVAGFTPVAVLESRRRRRMNAFLRNLPDTLQMIAGSLRAGYGVIQSIDTVAKETSGPAAEEFQRVITETRLGMPVEDALEAMADRIGSDDFRWVVLAINIQREVGGNLAELLDGVAETLREREALRRQIDVLSAEGKLSAVVLLALPIVLVIYLIIVRPEYIGTLVTSGLFGWMMVIGGSLLMLGGVFWIRRLIQIEV